MSALLVGLVLAPAAALLAYRAGALTLDGALAAAITGTLVFAAGGLPWATLMLLFFLSSSALSRLPRSRTAGIVDKGGRRDALQVASNGGPAALAALLALLHPATPWSVPVAASLAAATADTWATEIGSRFGSSPILITTLRPVVTGTSGGVTRTGTAAALAGSTMLGLASLLITPHLARAALVAILGLGGALLDSVLGATLQEIRECPACGTRTEQRVHGLCGTPTVHLHGVPYLDNDAVNLISTALAALVALLAVV